MRPARRRPARRVSAAIALAALLTSVLPVLRVAATGPVKVRGEEVATSVTHQRLIRLPFEASHVALRWRGAPEANLTIAFGQLPTLLGEEVPVALDHDERTHDADANGSDDRHESDAEHESISGVIWTGGARFARVTTDRAIGSLKVLAIDAVDRRVSGPGAGSVVNAAVAQPAVISRAGWGADESYRFDSGGYERFAPSYDPLQKAIVHHTAGRNNDPNPEATIRAIYYMHAVSRGYGDIDYNFLIDWQGRIYEGRHSHDYGSQPITGEDQAGKVVRGAHASNFNDGTVGIALLGNFTSVLPPSAQRGALEKLLAWKLERHGINPLGAGTYENPVLGNTKYLHNISGHRNVNATACPGAAFYATFPALRQAVADRIAATTGSSVDHTAPAVTSLVPMVPDPSGAITIPFGLIFREPVTGLEPDDFVVTGTSTGWTIGSITGTAATYQVNVLAPDGDLPDEGSVMLSLTDGSVMDLGGNVGPLAPVESTANYAHDDEPPTVVLYNTPHRSASNAEFFDWTATFSEPVLGFELADVVIGGPDGDEWIIERVLGSGASYIFTTKQPVLSDGTFSLSIPEGALTDLAGNSMAASPTWTIKADRSAPWNVSPTASLRADATLNGGSIWARVAWRAEDVGPAGIASYDIARSYDGKAFATLATAVTGTSVFTNMTPGHTYRYQVRTRDKAGNVGAWKAGPTLTPSLVEQSSSAVKWSGLTATTTSSSYSGGSQRHLREPGAWASYTTSARSLSFVTTRGPHQGSVKVYIDGVLQATIDLRSTATTYRYVAYSKTWPTRGTHTIKVVSVGTPVARVDVDAFGVIR